MKSGDSIKVLYPLFPEEEGGAIPTSPLQFEFREIKPQLASELNQRWHSRLPRIDWSCITRNTHYVCYGAMFDKQIFAVGIWSSPVAQNRFKDGKTILELRRLAISSSAPKNTASRMIGVMTRLVHKKFPDITRLISYQDTDVHTGTIYKASGWIIGGESKMMSWDTASRKRNKDQSTAKKIRWEKLLET